MKYPIELFVYAEDAHDVPVDAWRCDDVDTVRYLCADLKCEDCGSLKECERGKVGLAACMSIVCAEGNK
jgi:hypothetical protein